MPTDAPLRVLLADDHAMIRDGLKCLIDAQTDMTVIAEAADGREALRLAESLAPDVALVDISMPVWDGVQLAQALTRSCPAVRLLAVTRHVDEVFVVRMMAVGTAGYVLKQSPTVELLRAIREVAQGGQYIDPGVRRRHERPSLPDAATAGPPASTSLTAEEEQVLRMMAESCTREHMAERLAMDVDQILALRTSAMDKAGLVTRMQVISYSRSRGWLLG